MHACSTVSFRNHITGFVLRVGPASSVTYVQLAYFLIHLQGYLTLVHLGLSGDLLLPTFLPQIVLKSRQCTTIKPSNLMNWAWREETWSRCTGKWQMAGTRESGCATCNGGGFLQTLPWRLRMPTRGRETCGRHTNSTSTSPMSP